MGFALVVIRQVSSYPYPESSMDKLLTIHRADMRQIDFLLYYDMFTWGVKREIYEYDSRI